MCLLQPILCSNPDLFFLIAVFHVTTAWSKVKICSAHRHDMTLNPTKKFPIPAMKNFCIPRPIHLLWSRCWSSCYWWGHACVCYVVRWSNRSSLCNRTEMARAARLTSPGRGWSTWMLPSIWLIVNSLYVHAFLVRTVIILIPISGMTSLGKSTS